MSDKNLFQLIGGLLKKNTGWGSIPYPITLFLLTFSLTSCSVFSPVKMEPTNTYVLTSTPAVAAKKTHPITLLVNYPQTSAMNNTTQMAYSTERFEIAYFAKNQWADTPAQMLLPLMASTLQNTHYFRQVITPGMLGQYDYVLNTQLLKIQQIFYDHSSLVEIVLRAQLVNAVNNKIIASQDFSVEENAFPTPYGGVVAMNRAVSLILSQLAEFVSK